MTDSNKAQLYFGECQLTFRPDPYSQIHVSLFPQTIRVCMLCSKLKLLKCSLIAGIN